ncbi:MAG: S41 family peptidase [Candidatus Daviesbacteria bacterium]|nr:S41 family peptidase [Candidatus Daviesbacteria bacterium]
MKIKNFFEKINLWTLLIILLMFVLGWQLGHREYSLSLRNDKPKNSIDFKLFWQTWNLLSLKYINNKSIDPQKLYYGAIQGMVAAVGDPYTVFLPPEAQKSTKEQLGGAFNGVGIQLGYNKDKRLVVIAPLKDTPADKAGVKAGDLIIEINAKDTANLSLPEAVSLIRGQKGTSVKLALYRENESKPRDVTLVRDTIVVKTVEYSLKTTKSGKNIALIRVSSFGEKTKSEWDAIITEILAQNPQGIIIDVRNNPGGFLDASVYLASEFLNGGKVVMQEDGQGTKQDLQVTRTGQMLTIPLVILINKGSASASEILAGAIQDRKRGTLIGDQSFGKGTIQSSEDLPENTGIHITTAKWLTPLGRWIHDVGLTPDMKVEIPTDWTPAKPDPQVEKALEILN